MVEGTRARRGEMAFCFAKSCAIGLKSALHGGRFGAGLFNCRVHGGLLVHREIVEHDNVARPQHRSKHLLDEREERGSVDRAVEDRGRGQAIDAESRDDGVRVPVPVGRVIAQAHATGTPTVAAQQICRDARFVDEDVGARVVQRLGVLPPAAIGGDVRTSLLVGVYGFF